MLKFKGTGPCISTYVAAALKEARVWRGEDDVWPADRCG